MALDRDTAEQVAHLARLRLAPEQAADVAEDLSRVLDLIDQIEQVDTSEVTPLAHPLDLSQPLREDAVTSDWNREELQKSAPDVVEGYYRVPRSVE
ncbi:glutamyl-tRNA amidotransferase [Thiohalorhabdus denitrificans]|uniref:Aspartyl/glutamyl-tRNA(Asn/Gln) amidotransferase subunit C n=1 Tax=Thiohalorhabdus denitrificans TaxID=381306 RepID=A0A0P9C711_9GAMM|nr:Asp-tRNA(Asn)/Glu-tRNA(Gln) amidotransferase subunit GatC [Thiohalorhabdus denitrificans]KPV40650.1 glutamyl-tRNA amidotransferase [Thiohalorhabdus denitrificans]SCY48270.1 aspartyl/glutamyl-tRNA(Asn/Gln) amidotransferase subunit C [Thiohalorhabdus denitrificans]